MTELEQKDSKMISVIVVKPGEMPVLKEIERKLETMQEIVGGYIEQVCPFDDCVSLICNEEGKLCGLSPNRSLKNEKGEIYDIIAGTFFIAYSPPDSENFEPLPENLAEKYINEFKYPEFFLYRNGKIDSFKIFSDENSNVS